MTVFTINGIRCVRCGAADNLDGSAKGIVEQDSQLAEWERRGWWIPSAAHQVEPNHHGTIKGTCKQCPAPGTSD